MAKRDEDLAGARELAIVGGEGGELGGAVSAGAAKAEAGVGGGGVDLWRGEVAGLIAGMRDAESGVALAEEIEDGLRQPGRVAELKGDARRR